MLLNQLYFLLWRCESFIAR